MNTALTRCLEALGYVVYPPKNHGISTPLERDGSNGGGISAAQLYPETSNTSSDPWTSTRAKLVQGKIVLGAVLIFIQVIHTPKCLMFQRLIWQSSKLMEAFTSYLLYFCPPCCCGLASRKAHGEKKHPEQLFAGISAMSTSLYYTKVYIDCIYIISLCLKFMLYHT